MNSFTDAICNLASALMAHENYPDAVGMFELFTADVDDDASAFFCLGECYGKVGNDAAARDALKRGLELDSENDQARLNLGNILVKMKDPVSGILEYKKAISLNPSNIAAHKNFAFTLAEEGELDLAVESLKRVLELDSRDEEALMYKQELERMIAAKQKLQDDIAAAKVVAASPGATVNALARLGQLLNADDQVEEAAEAFKRALGLQPGHPKLTVMLEECERELARSRPVTLDAEGGGGGGGGGGGDGIADGNSKFFREENSPADNQTPQSASQNPDKQEQGAFGMFGNKKKGRRRDSLNKKGSSKVAIAASD